MGRRNPHWPLLEAHRSAVARGPGIGAARRPGSAGQPPTGHQLAAGAGADPGAALRRQQRKHSPEYGTRVAAAEMSGRALLTSDIENVLSVNGARRCPRQLSVAN